MLVVTSNDTDPPSVLWELAINISLFVAFMFLILLCPLPCGILNSVDAPPTDREGQLCLHVFGSDIVSAHVRDIQWKPHCYELT